MDTVQRCAIYRYTAIVIFNNINSFQAVPSCQYKSWPKHSSHQPKQANISAVVNDHQIHSISYKWISFRNIKIPLVDPETLENNVST